MEENILSEYAEFALWGVLGGCLSFVLWGILGNVGIVSLFSWYFYLYKLIILLPPILGGFLGGAITKKWWGAFVGGFILNFIQAMCIDFVQAF